MLQSSAYRTNRCLRRSNSRSNSSSTRLLSKGESGPPCGVPSTLGLTNPFCITPAFRNARMSFKSRVPNPLGDLPHQFVVIDSVEEFLQIEVYHPAVARRDVLLRPLHCLMRRPSRSKTIAAIGECPIPILLQYLHHRQLDEPVQHRWNAQQAHPSLWFRYFHPSYGLRFIGPFQQLFSEGLKLAVIRKLIHRLTVYSRATLIGLDAPHCLLQVSPLTDLLHHPVRLGWAFVLVRRQQRFGLSRPAVPSFTGSSRPGVRFRFLPLVVAEIHDLLATPLSF